MGGYSAIEATIVLFKLALKDKTFDRFVILQGLEYPIRSNSEIIDFFRKHVDTEFIKAQDISHSTDWHEYHKFRLYWRMDERSIFVKIIHKMNKEFQKKEFIPYFKKNFVKSNDGTKMFIHQGCAQFSVTRVVAEYIVKFHDNNFRFNQYFKTVFAPDESYFHTIIYNSKYVDRILDGKAITRPHLTDFENLTYFEYPKQIKLFIKKEEWPKLRDSGFLFFRKASSDSKELLDYIDWVHRELDT